MWYCIVLHGISSRAFAAIWYCTLCDRYAITIFFTCIFFFYNFKCLIFLGTSPCECSALVLVPIGILMIGLYNVMSYFVASH